MIVSLLNSTLHGATTSFSIGRILGSCGTIRQLMLALISITLVKKYHMYLIHITHSYVQLHIIIRIMFV